MSDRFEEATKKLTSEDQQALKERYYQEFLHPLSLENRVRFLQDQMPHVWSRIVLLEYLQRLQQERGGHFEGSVAFIHASTAQGGVAFNVKIVGQIDYFGHVIFVETYQHEDIEPGVVVLPLDTILWVGVTDEPLNKGEMGFGGTHETRRGRPLDTRRLAGLPVEGDGSKEADEAGVAPPADGAEPASPADGAEPAPPADGAEPASSPEEGEAQTRPEEKAAQEPDKQEGSPPDRASETEAAPPPGQGE